MRLPLVMLAVSYLLALAIDIYITADLRWHPDAARRPLFPWRNNRLKAPWLSVYCSAAGFLLLTVAVCMPRRGDASLQPVMWLLYIFVTVYAGKLAYVVGSAIGRIPQLWRGHRRDTRMWLGITFAAVAVFSMVWGAVVGRRHIEVKQVSVSSPRLPSQFDGYRIVQFSDTHLDSWGNDTAFASKLVEQINALNADLIVFTGDVVSRQSSELRPFLSVLSRLHALDGVFSVMGNHDYGDYHDWPSEAAHSADIAAMRAMQDSMGWHLLDNTGIYITHGSDSIRLLGVENWGEPPFRQYGDLDLAMRNCPDSGAETFTILLSHNPMHWHEVVSKSGNIDLTLSGHTHAMQCQFSIGGLRWSPASWRYPEWSGLYSTSASGMVKLSQLYVNIGVGEVAMPSRIGTAFPELTLITLKRGDGNGGVQKKK